MPNFGSDCAGIFQTRVKMVGNAIRVLTALHNQLELKLNKSQADFQWLEEAKFAITNLHTLQKHFQAQEKPKMNSLPISAEPFTRLTSSGKHLACRTLIYRNGEEFAEVMDEDGCPVGDGQLFDLAEEAMEAARRFAGKIHRENALARIDD